MAGGLEVQATTRKLEEDMSTLYTTQALAASGWFFVDDFAEIRSKVM